MEGTDFQMTVDQETNQMVATYTPKAGTYPIWIIDGTSYSTLSEVGYTNTEAGTHTVELKLGNRNGISQAGVSKTFTFNETKIDWSADFRRITGKEWRIDNKEVGHMGCGPAGTDATEWWSAAVNDKKDFGVYDDRLTFTADTRKGGAYSYNAGPDGMTYVNKGCTTWDTQNEAADVDVAIGNQTATWEFAVLDWKKADGEVVTGNKYIQLAANTAFPYISSDAQYQNPLFRVEQLTNSKMVLYYETPDRSIAWRFVFTSAAEQRLVEESGFDASSDFNLWKGITPTATFHFQPGWADVRTSEMESAYIQADNDYTVTVPDACSDRWQAQFHLHTDLAISAANHYDFSCIFVADADIDGVTVKLTISKDGNNYFGEDQDGNKLQVYDKFGIGYNTADIEGKTFNITGIIIPFNTSFEIAPIEDFVGAPDESCENIAAFKQLENGATAVLKLTDAQVLYNGGNDVYVKDASGAIDFFKSGLELKAGDILNGTIKAKFSVYNNTPELTGVVESDIEITEGTVTPETMDVRTAAGEENICNLVRIQDVTVYYEETTNDDGSKTYQNWYDSSNKYVQFYDKWKIGYELQDGETYTFTGIMVLYGEQPEMYVTVDPTNAGATAISNVNAEQNANAPIYNMAGQRVSNAVKGVFIQNGKKFVIK